MGEVLIYVYCKANRKELNLSEFTLDFSFAHLCIGDREESGKVSSEGGVCGDPVEPADKQPPILFLG